MSVNGSVQETGAMSRSNTGLSNGSPSDFEVLSHPSSAGSQTPVSLSNINPFGVVSPAPSSMTDITLEQALTRVQDLSRENNELRDYLKDNNEMMKKQYDSLASWKKKVHDANIANREKFEQTKALIVGLRKDNEELHERVQELELSKEEKENELLKKIHVLESARVASEHMATEVRRHAEEQGMSMDDLSLTLKETVVVTVSAETEERITQLERQIEERNQMIDKLYDTNKQLGVQVEQFRSSTDQLLKDVEATQKLKEDIQRENQELHEKNLDLNLRLQGVLSDTKHSIQMVEKASPYQSTRSGLCDSVGQEALQEQLQRNEEKFKAETSALRVQQEQDRKKMEQLQSQLTNSNRKLDITHQHHEQEVAMLRKEHEQKLTELAQQQNTEKEQQLESSTYDSDVQSLRSQVLTLISEVHETQTKLAAATDAISRKDKRCKEMEEKNSRCQMEINQQRYDYSMMAQTMQQRCGLAEQALGKERQTHEATRRQMSHLQTSFEQLVNDYKELLDTFDQFKMQQERQQEGASMQEQRVMTEKINHLTAQVMAAEEALAMRDEAIARMKEELKNSQREYEDMAAVFKAQAEVYKGDFDAEREAREKQVTEKERVLQEMGELQTQNQRLLDELDTYSRRQMSEMARRVAPTHSYLQVGNPGGPYGPPPAQGYPYPAAEGMAETRSQDNTNYPETVDLNQQPNQAQGSAPGGAASQHDEDDTPLVCPQCNLTCPDMDTLQIHVIECLEINS